MARRLRRLGGIELVNAVLLPLLVSTVAPPSLALAAGWTAACSVLVVGATYWFARAERLRRRLSRTPGLAMFATARIALLAVLAISAVVVLVDLVRGDPAVGWVGAVVWLFAVAEYVNYFRRQLSYQNRADLHRLARRRRLLPALLGRELQYRSAERRRAGPSRPT